MTGDANDQCRDDTDRDEWDEQWVRICEMEAGSEDPFPEFASDVRAAMEHTGNEVGRPLVMKVTVQVYDGELNRSVDTGTEHDSGDSS